MGTDTNATVSRHIRLQNNGSECQRLYRFIDESLAQIPLTQEFRHDIKLAAEELLANIINHGYPEHAQASVDIDLAVDAHSVRITFTDCGIAFNPLDSKQPDTPTDLSAGGMGITLVKSLTDEQSYQRDNNRNVLTVTKNYTT